MNLEEMARSLEDNLVLATEDLQSCEDDKVEGIQSRVNTLVLLLLGVDVVKSLRTIAAGTIPPTVTIDGMELLGEHTEKLQELQRRSADWEYVRVLESRLEQTKERIAALESLVHVHPDSEQLEMYRLSRHAPYADKES